MKIIKTVWVFEFSDRARAEFKQLDKFVQERIKSKIKALMTSGENPRTQMKKLTGEMKNLHSMRVGTYRVLCEIRNNELKILAVSIGHRRHVYEA